MCVSNAYYYDCVFLIHRLFLQVNGINTQGENIADNGGLKQSFRVSQRLNPVNKKLSTNEIKIQMIFILTIMAVKKSKMRPVYWKV
mgnify:CR=1 FL=1